MIRAAEEVECCYLLEEFPSKTRIQFSDHLEPCDFKKDITSELVHELAREARPHRRTVLCHSCLHIPCSGLDGLYEKIEQVRERYLSNFIITIILRGGHSSFSWTPWLIDFGPSQKELWQRLVFISRFNMGSRVQNSLLL